MKKKKLLVLLPAVLLMLGSCDPNDSSSSVVPPDPSSSTSSVTPPDSSSEVKTGKVTIITAEHVTVTADKAEAKVGETVTFTIQVDDTYELAYFKVNGADVTVTGGKATATMVEGGLSVTFSAVSKKYAVTITSVDHVTVTSDVSETIIGATVTFTVTPDEGYELVTFKVNDNPVTVTGGKATYQMVKDGLVAVASVEKIKYSVSIPSEIANGTVTADKETAAEGDDVTFTVKADDDYELDYFKVNGSDVAVVDNKATVKMVKEGLSVTVAFKATKYKVTIPTEIVNGTVTADKETAVVGEDVTFTVTPNEGYEIKSFKVNGDEKAVTENKATVKMVRDGLTVTVEFADHFDEISAIDDAFIAKVTAANIAKYKLAEDITAESLPVAKVETIVDLNGKTLTVSSDKVLTGTAGMKITVKNGTIKITGEKGTKSTNFFNVSEANSLTLSGITLTNDNEMYVTSSIINASSNNYLTIADCVFNTKTTYGIATNNLEGKVKGEFKITKTKITVTTADFDNCGFIVNTDYGTKVTIEDSTITADRQAVIARTGDWSITGDTTLKITGKWLESEAHVATNEGYLKGSWGNGNEVPSTTLCVGDNTTPYKCDASVVIDGVKLDANGGTTIVGRTDGTYKTTIEMDALTYLNNYESIDVTDDVTVKKNNVIEKTVAEMNAMTTSDSKNLYMVTGTISEITDTTYGNGTLKDADGKGLVVYGSYTADSASGYYIKNGAYTFNNYGKKGVGTDYVGQEVTMIGVFDYFNGTPEIKNAITFINDKTASVTTEYDANQGTVTLNKSENVAFGDEIVVTVTPNDGFKVASVTVSKNGGEAEDITQTLTFVAAKTNKVVVKFIDTTTPVAYSYKLDFANYKSAKITGSAGNVNTYDNKWTATSNKLSYTMNNINGQTSDIRMGWRTAAKVCSIQNDVAFANKIGTIDIDFSALTASTVNSAYILVGTDATFAKYSEKVDLALSKAGTLTTNIKTPTAGCYYKIVFDMKQTSGNGTVKITSITFNETI